MIPWHAFSVFSLLILENICLFKKYFDHIYAFNSLFTSRVKKAFFIFFCFVLQFTRIIEKVSFPLMGLTLSRYFSKIICFFICYSAVSLLAEIKSDNTSEAWQSFVSRVSWIWFRKEIAYFNAKFVGSFRKKKGSSFFCSSFEKMKSFSY